MKADEGVLARNVWGHSRLMGLPVVFSRPGGHGQGRYTGFLIWEGQGAIEGEPGSGATRESERVFLEGASTVEKPCMQSMRRIRT